VTAGKDARGKSLLTTREREVFELLVQDKTTKEIADTLFISEKTVRNHISNLMHTHCKPFNQRAPSRNELHDTTTHLPVHSHSDHDQKGPSLRKDLIYTLFRNTICYAISSLISKMPSSCSSSGTA
jgi:hypothetical protein